MHELAHLSQKALETAQLTWFSPPHSPAGGFAPKPLLPTTTPLAEILYAAGLTSKLHRAHSKFSLLTWIVLPVTGIDLQPQT